MTRPDATAHFLWRQFFWRQIYVNPISSWVQYLVSIRQILGHHYQQRMLMAIASPDDSSVFGLILNGGNFPGVKYLSTLY